jgi:hypothetical protein
VQFTISNQPGKVFSPTRRVAFATTGKLAVIVNGGADAVNPAVEWFIPQGVGKLMATSKQRVTVVEGCGVKAYGRMMAGMRLAQPPRSTSAVYLITRHLISSGSKFNFQQREVDESTKYKR